MRLQIVGHNSVTFTSLQTDELILLYWQQFHKETVLGTRSSQNNKNKTDPCLPFWWYYNWGVSIAIQGGKILNKRTFLMSALRTGRVKFQRIPCNTNKAVRDRTDWWACWRKADNLQKCKKNGANRARYRTMVKWKASQWREDFSGLVTSGKCSWSRETLH